MELRHTGQDPEATSCPHHYACACRRWRDCIRPRKKRQKKYEIRNPAPYSRRTTSGAHRFVHSLAGAPVDHYCFPQYNVVSHINLLTTETPHHTTTAATKISLAPSSGVKQLHHMASSGQTTRQIVLLQNTDTAHGHGWHRMETTCCTYHVECMVCNMNSDKTYNSQQT